MSTKTTFKRIALVAVAALGLGVLSVAPSQAVVSGLTAGSTNGSTATDNSYSDTSTSGVVEVAYLALTTADTVTVRFETTADDGATERTPRPNAATATSAMRLNVVFVDICFLSIVELRTIRSSAWN